VIDHAAHGESVDAVGDATRACGGSARASIATAIAHATVIAPRIPHFVGIRADGFTSTEPHFPHEAGVTYGGGAMHLPLVQAKLAQSWAAVQDAPPAWATTQAPAGQNAPGPHWALPLQLAPSGVAGTQICTPGTQ